MRRGKLKRFITPMMPPLHLRREVEEGERGDAIYAPIKGEWEKLAAPFQEKDPAEARRAYMSLLKMRERLSEHEEAIEERGEESFLQYDALKQLVACCEEKAIEYGFDEKIEGMLGTEKWDCLPEDERADPQHGGFSYAVGHTSDPDDPWTWKQSSPRADLRFEMKLPDEAFGEPERVHSDNHHAIFSANTTWREAIEQTKARAVPHRDSSRRCERTARLVAFRRSVLENILYQYEVFGVVPAELSDAHLKRAERETQGADATPHRQEQAANLCRALADHLKENEGQYPDEPEHGEPFCGSLEQLYSWGTDFIKADGSKSVYRALRDTGLLPLGKQGDSTRLSKCLENMKDYAKDIQADG